MFVLSFMAGYRTPLTSLAPDKRFIGARWGQEKWRFVKSFDYKREAFEYFISHFKEDIGDDFVIGHEMGEELPIEISEAMVDVVDGTFGEKAIQRTLKFDKKKQRAVEFVLTSTKLIIAYHAPGSWGASSDRRVVSQETIWLTDSEELWPRLTGTHIERGPLLGSSCRLMVLVQDKKSGLDRPLGFILEDKWLPSLLSSIRWKNLH